MDIANIALKSWPKIIKVVQHWENQSKSKRPNNKSYENLVKCYTDKSIPVKLKFSLISRLKGSLSNRQAHSTFSVASLVVVFHTLMKAEVLDEICGDNVSSFNLSKINLAKSGNLVYHELIKLPTATKALLKSLALPVDKKRQFLKKIQSHSGCINQ